MDIKEVGRRIRYFRKLRNISQRELADKIGVTWEMISRYENAHSNPLVRIGAIARALNVDVADLLQSYNKSSQFFDKTSSYMTPVTIPLIKRLSEDINTAQGLLDALRHSLLSYTALLPSELKGDLFAINFFSNKDILTFSFPYHVIGDSYGIFQVLFQENRDDLSSVSFSSSSDSKYLPIKEHGYFLFRVSSKKEEVPKFRIGWRSDKTDSAEGELVPLARLIKIVSEFI